MMILSGAVALGRRCSAATNGCRRFFATTPYQIYEEVKRELIEARRRREAEEEQKRAEIDAKRGEVLSRLNQRYINPYATFKVSSYDYSSAKTVMWWDLDGAVIPDSCTDFRRLLDNIRCSVNYLGYAGPFCFRGYGDFTKLSPAIREQIKVNELNVSEIPEEDTFTHIPAKQESGRNLDSTANRPCGSYSQVFK